MVYIFKRLFRKELAAPIGHVARVLLRSTLHVSGSRPSAVFTPQGR